MSYTIPFPAAASLSETETTVEFYQLGKTANMIDIVGRNAEFSDGTKADVNLVEFEPVDHKYEIRKELAFVPTDKVDFGAMAAAGMTQLGGDGHEFTVFVSGKPESIFIFYRM